MQVTSAEYKEEQKHDLRNASHVFVYLGIVNKDAQKNAYINKRITSLEPYSTEEIYQETPFEAYYASLEQNFTRVDGSFFFLPRENIYGVELMEANGDVIMDDAGDTLMGEEVIGDPPQYALFQGAVTSGVKGDIRFDFNGFNDLSIKGLTLNFGDYYPTEFSISNGTTTKTYTDNTETTFITEDVFNATEYIRIHPITMVGGNQRLRLRSILFGVGLTFDNQTLISTSRKNTIDHLSNALPSKQFTFTVNNIGGRFSKDDPYSFANFLKAGQDCTYEYGREMDDGSIYRIDGGNVLLKTWSSNDTQAKFTCVGYMDFMGDTYYKGRYYDPETYGMARLIVEDVLEDAGIENYQIDSSLSRIYFQNPLPITTHKNCLQLIANACRCRLYEDRHGTIVIASAYKPDILRVWAFDWAEYSEYDSVISGSPSTTDYATLENHFTRVNGSMKFMPTDISNVVPVGLVSEYVSNSGRFFYPYENDEPSFVIEWEASWTFYNIKLTYADGTEPDKIRVVARGPGSVRVLDKEITDDTTFVEGEFVNCEAVQIQFKYTKYPYQRVHLKSVAVGDVSNYEITYHELANTPTATSSDIAKTVNVQYTEYVPEDEYSDVIEDAEVDAGDHVFQFTTPYNSSDYRMSFNPYTSGELSVVEDGSYFIKIHTTGAGEFGLAGRKLVAKENTYTYEANETGVIKTVKNPMIHKKSMAEDVAKWVADYYSSTTEYSVSFRGEPAIDCDDLIYLENQFVDENLIRITSETLDTGTGMGINSHKLKAVRVSYKERTT